MLGVQEFKGSQIFIGILLAVNVLKYFSTNGKEDRMCDVKR